MAATLSNGFRCDMCGMCCRNVKRYKEEVYPVLKTWMGEAMPDCSIEDNDGICVYLKEDNRCSIYDHRPIICNTDEMFNLISRTIGIDKKELIMAQMLSCNINRNNKIINKTNDGN